MPNITDFNAGNLEIRPTETGVESFAQAGRRAGAFYNQTAQDLRRTGQELGQGVREAGDVAVNYMSHQDVSALAASGAQLYGDQIEKKDAAIKAIDPNDPHYGQKVELAVKEWRENSLEPALQKLSAGASTQKGQDFAERFVDNTRQSMFVHSTQDIASAAHVGIMNSAHTLVNTATTTAFKDPNTLSSQLDLVDQGITGLVDTSPVKGTDAARVQSEVSQKAKEQIVKAAVQGAIMKGGNWQAIAKKYPDYVNAAEMAQFERAERTQERVNTAYSKQATLAQKQLDTLNVETAANKAFTDNVKIDPSTNRPVIDPQFFKDALDVARKYPNAPNAATTVRTLLDWGESQQKPQTEKIINDPAVYGNLNTRLLDPDNPTSAIDVLRAEADHKLTHSDGAAMRELITARDELPLRNPAFKDTMSAVKDNFTFGANLADDPVGSAAYARFMQAFLPEYLREQRAGTLQPNALDMRDPKSMISQAIAQARQPLSATITFPAPQLSTVKPPPDMLKELPDVQYDTAAGRFFVIRAGRKMWVNKAAQETPAMPEVPMR